MNKCGHPVPVFGCDGCIEMVRSAWEKATYLKFYRDYQKKPGRTCGRHGTRMEPYTSEIIKGKLHAILTCQTLRNGEFICEDQDVAVPLE